MDLNSLLGMGGGKQPRGAGQNDKKADTSEQVIISALPLLKMLKYARAGIPFEVMGNLMGTYVDEYTTKVVDIFSMPVQASAVSVEDVDPVFQTKMVEMLQQTDRTENTVGWYHSHPGYGCWLSSTDMNTQQAYEQIEQRSIAIVVDPVQSVKGKVVIDSFKLIDNATAMSGAEPRQTTSIVGKLNKPNVQQLFHGLNRYYFN